MKRILLPALVLVMGWGESLTKTLNIKYHSITQNWVFLDNSCLLIILGKIFCIDKMLLKWRFKYHLCNHFMIMFNIIFNSICFHTYMHVCDNFVYKNNSCQLGKTWKVRKSINKKIPTKKLCLGVTTIINILSCLQPSCK